MDRHRLRQRRRDRRRRSECHQRHGCHIAGRGRSERERRFRLVLRLPRRRDGRALLSPGRHVYVRLRRQERRLYLLYASAGTRLLVLSRRAGGRKWTHFERCCGFIHWLPGCAVLYVRSNVYIRVQREGDALYLLSASTRCRQMDLSIGGMKCQGRTSCARRRLHSASPRLRPARAMRLVDASTLRAPGAGEVAGL